MLRWLITPEKLAEREKKAPALKREHVVRLHYDQKKTTCNLLQPLALEGSCLPDAIDHIPLFNELELLSCYMCCYVQSTFRVSGSYTGRMVTSSTTVQAGTSHAYPCFQSYQCS